MELFIRVKDGKPFEHPIFKDNFCAAFPDVDLQNLPSEFARFERLPPPSIGVYEVYEGVTYEAFDGVYKDVHHVRPMTPQEKTEKQNSVKADWSQHGFASWVFNEETCSFDPPSPYPADGQRYRWDENTLSWILLP